MLKNTLKRGKIEREVFIVGFPSTNNKFNHHLYDNANIFE
jgi:hypothetical protein